MYLTTKSGRKILLNTPKRTPYYRSALTDPDNLPLTDAELKQFKRGRGRPMGSGKKSK